VKKLVFISSCSVYGEPRYLPIDENHPLNANSPYAASKIAAEKLCRDFCRQKGLDVVILRLFNVYGPRQATSPYGGVIAKWVYRMSRKLPLVIFGDGTQTRDFVCVHDVAGAVLRVLRADEVGGETFNVGSGRAVSMNELAKDLLGITNADLRIIYEEEKDGDVKASLASIAKAREVLGYEPRVDLETGLRSMFQTEVK
jgi:UDP-glucose 4-epimerase